MHLILYAVISVKKLNLVTKALQFYITMEYRDGKGGHGNFYSPFTASRTVTVNESVHPTARLEVLLVPHFGLQICGQEFYSLNPFGRRTCDLILDLLSKDQWRRKTMASSIALLQHQSAFCGQRLNVSTNKSVSYGKIQPNTVRCFRQGFIPGEDRAKYEGVENLGPVSDSTSSLPFSLIN